MTGKRAGPFFLLLGADSRRRAALALGLASLFACQPYARPIGPPETSPPRLSIEGLIVSASEGGQLSSRLRADQLLVVPKRFGPIELGPFEELVMTGVRLELFGQPSTPGMGWRRRSFGLGQSVLLGVAQGPSLAGMTIYRIDVTVVGEAGPESHLSAARGEVDAHHARLVLRDVAIEEIASGRTLHAARAYWREGTRDLTIPGAWVLKDGFKVTRGHGLVADLGLRTVTASGR